MCNLTKDDCYKQIEVLLKERQMHWDHRAKIKNWSVTIWLGIVVAISTGKLQLEQSSLLMLMLLSVIVFWFLEAMHGAICHLLFQQVVEYEEKISNIGEKDSCTILPAYTGYLKHSNSDKLKAFILCFSRMESVNLLYIFLVVLSIGFYFIAL